MGATVVTVGVVVVGAIVLDAVVTTLAPGAGAGAITGRVGRACWRTGHRLATGPGSWVLAATGPLAVVSTVGIWILGLAAGWAMIFIGLGPEHLGMASGTVLRAGDAAFFAVTTLFTLGPGDVVPISGLGQAVTGVAVVNGLALVTLAISYLIPVVTAVTGRRIQAATLSAYGTTAPQILRLLVAADGRAGPDQLVRDAALAVRTTAQRHLAYPVLHFFHSRERTTSFAPSVAAFTEAVLATEQAGAARLHPAHRAAFVTAVEQLLQITDRHLRSHLRPEPPPAPNGRHALPGEPPPPDSERHRELRRRLAAFVADGGWSWDDDVIGRP